MSDEAVRYEVKVVQAVRGTEARAIAKWESDGWEYVDREQRTLRTTLHFRRPRPKTLLDYVGESVSAFRRLRPTTQLAVAASSVLIVGAGTLGIAAAAQGGVDTSQPSAASDTPSEQLGEDPAPIEPVAEVSATDGPVPQASSPAPPATSQTNSSTSTPSTSSQPSTTVAPTEAPRPKPAASTAPARDPQFSTCREAVDAGYGPYIQGQDPEYTWYRDRDKDGVVCER